jgi:stress response protein SCP2
MIYDAQGRLLETIHGGRPRNANESVVHTGDSRNGASRWDDERIFVFADALPQSVERLAFVVVCANRGAFCEVPGATCHVTDHSSEHEWLRMDLTALRYRSFTAATLRRTSRGWSLAAGRDEAQETAASPSF